jgi:branched-chain amino acid transport system ATP-binding protein
MPDSPRLRLSEAFPDQHTVMFGRGIAVQAGMRLYVQGEDSPRLHKLFLHLSGEAACEPGTKWMDGMDVSHLRCPELVKLGLAAGSARARAFQSLNLEEHFRIRVAAIKDDRSPEYWLNWARDRYPVLSAAPATVCGNFSGGEQQTLMLALATIGHPRVVVLEEPWMGLAAGAAQDASRVLDSLAEEGTAIVSLSQDAPPSSVVKSMMVLRL